MRGALSYNENKVAVNAAQCIAAVNFGRQAQDLSFHEKLNRFTNLTRWNQKVRTNTLHISLNFDPSEQLSKETLERIACSYMQRIGFGDQPYLVYEHFDAAHPHLHIVSTNIQRNGKAINLHNLGRLRSEPARKEIEKEFKLVHASDKSRKAKTTTVSVSQYGKVETKRAIANAVGFVTRSYRYTSVAELNAVLRQFNIAAHQGSEGSIMFRKGGLVYSFIDENGKPKGIPIKASALHFKPTLKFLQKQFTLNEVLRKKGREGLAEKITVALSGKPTLTEFQNRLHVRNIIVVLRHAKDNRVFGMTFVDNSIKIVFNGSDLSKNLGAKAILERLQLKEETATKPKSKERDLLVSEPLPTGAMGGDMISMLSAVLVAEESDTTSNLHLFRKRKRRKRRKNH
jgi:hypothetical protein